MYVCMHVCMYVCMYAHMSYTDIYIHIYIYMAIYIHTCSCTFQGFQNEELPEVSGLLLLRLFVTESGWGWRFLWAPAHHTLVQKAAQSGSSLNILYALYTLSP